MCQGGGMCGGGGVETDVVFGVIVDVGGVHL